MKKITLLLVLLSVTFGYAQFATVDFETASGIAGFDGCVATEEVTPAAQTAGSNTSLTPGKLAMLVRDGNQTWAGAAVTTTAKIDFTTQKYIKFSLWTSAPTTQVFQFKLEDAANGQNINTGDITTTRTKTGEWETIVVDLSSQTSNIYDKIVFLPNNGTLGAGTANDTYFIDDITQSDNANTTLGVDSVTKVGYRTYPNPTLDAWNVLSTSSIKSISVFNVIGKQVINLTPNSNEAIIDASNLKSGVYFAKIEGASGSKTIKLVRQ